MKLIKSVIILGLIAIFSRSISQVSPILFKNDFNPIFQVEINNLLLFFTYDGVWKSDGTPNGTELIAGSPRVSNGSFGFVKFNSFVYFSAYSSSYTVSEIWKTDGTVAGTSLVTSIPNATGITNFEVLFDKLFFIVKKDFGNEKIWISDGTAAGTNQFIDLDPTNNINLCPKQLLNFNNQLFFWAGDGTSNYQHFYKTDGTILGTTPVLDIGDEYGYNLGGSATISNGKLYYFNGTNNTNTGLWVTDGTAVGTYLIKSLSNITSLTDINGTLYFAATDEGGLIGQTLYGDEPWKSDGTAAGTYLIKDIYPGYNSSCGSNFFEFNSKVYFGATNGTNGVELWQTDGTENGTQMVKDISPGSLSGTNNFSDAIAYNGMFYFRANDEQHGSELWKSDGTEAGTSLFVDFYPGVDNAGPNSFFTFNGILFFETYGNFEEKLWYLGNSNGEPNIHAENSFFQVSPNPSEGTFQIMSNKQMSGNVYIYNSSGSIIQAIEESTLSHIFIDLSNCSKGLYWIQLNSEQGVFTRKLVLN